jgi:hypothetical protein
MVPTVLALVGLQALSTTVAHAQNPAPRQVVVVAVAPAAPELDVPKLRAAIGAELQADAVGDDDARATLAHGRFDVSVDRAARELVVSYSGGAEPLVRRVALPADVRAEARAVVALAGNLGRDEASELAAELRKSAPPAPAPAPPPASDPEKAQNELDEKTLMRMLADDARRDRTTRVATSLTFITVGVAAMATGYLDPSSSSEQRMTSLVTPLGLPLIFVGIFGYPFVDMGVGLTRHSRLERLSEYYPPDSETGRPWARRQVEQMWKSEAIEAHRQREGIVAPLVGFGVIEVGLGALFLAEGDRHKTVEASIDISAITLGAGVTVWGLLEARAETNTESQLHGYERAVGRPIVEDVGVGIAPAPSGATVSLTGRF